MSRAYDTIWGHKYAAGLTIRTEQYDGFVSVLKRWYLDKFNPISKSELCELTWKFPLKKSPLSFIESSIRWHHLALAICGRCCCQKGLLNEEMPSELVLTETHLKCSFVAGAQSIDAIGFGLGDALEIVQSSACDIAYVVDENDWNGKTSLQLNLKG